MRRRLAALEHHALAIPTLPLGEGGRVTFDPSWIAARHHVSGETIQTMISGLAAQAKEATG